MRKFFISLIAVSLIIFPVCAEGQQDGSSFNWTMALERNGASVPFSEPVQSSIGERFQIIIKSDRDCFCYVIAETSEGDELIVLNSAALQAGEEWHSPVIRLSGQSGSESFFVITSLAEQRNLDRRIAAVNRNPGYTQRRALINEIFRLRREVSVYREIPEKPVLMGGATRLAPRSGTEYSGLGVYVKTISIEH